MEHLNITQLRHHSVWRGTKTFLGFENSRLQTCLGTSVHSSCGLRLGTSFVTTFRELVKTENFHSSSYSTPFFNGKSIFTSSLTSFHWMKVTGLLRLLDSRGDLSVKTLLLSFLDNTASTTNFQGNLVTFRVWPRLTPPVSFDKLKEEKHFQNISSPAPQSICWEQSVYLSGAGCLHSRPTLLWPWAITHFPVRSLTGHNVLKLFLVVENNSAFLFEKFFTDFLLGGFKEGNICLVTSLLHLLLTLEDRLPRVGLHHVCLNKTFFSIFCQLCISFLSVNF